MNKRGISPLISTVILIFLAIGVGLIVMNWGRAQLEENSKCAINTELRIVKLNNEAQICFDGQGSQGIVKFIVENGVNVDIDAVLFRIIGSKQPYELTLPDSKIEKGFTLQKVVPYNFETFGDIKQVKLTPRIKVFEEEPAIICPEQAIILENIKQC